MAEMPPNPQGLELSSELQLLGVNNSEDPLEYSAQVLADSPKDPTVWEMRRVLVGDLRTALEKELDFVGELAERDSRNKLIWQHRRWIVEQLGSEAASKDLKADLEKELDFVGEFAERDSRNHLIWLHRRWIVEKLGSEVASKELEFTKKILLKDSKIYQAWSHREWIVKKFGGSWWLAELQYCHDVLEKDIFNTFAWDQRCRVVRSVPNMEKECRDKEVTHAKKAIQAHPGNESAWTYLKCLYMKDQSTLYTDEDLESIYVDVLHKAAHCVEAVVELEEIDPGHNVVDLIVDKRGCVHALNLILDLIFLGYKGSDKLVHAVDVLFKHCGYSVSKVYPDAVPAKSELFRKVCSLTLSLDAKRICYCNNYCGYDGFKYLCSKYKMKGGCLEE